MPTYKIVISKSAKADLAGIVAYVSTVESVTTAKYVERGILSAMKRLEHFPAAYTKDEYANAHEKTIRFIVKWRYKILYYVEADTVHIVRIFHTAQNPEKLRAL